VAGLIPVIPVSKGLTATDPEPSRPIPGTVRMQRSRFGQREDAGPSITEGVWVGGFDETKDLATDIRQVCQQVLCLQRIFRKVRS
jgi:hypothetical protein